MPKEFSRNPELMDATGFSGDGSLLMFGQQVIEARADTPADPPADHCIIWMDSASGDLFAKLTNTAGTTKTGTILDFSAL